MKILKLVVLIFICTSLFVDNCFAQDTSKQIKIAWQNLKAQIEKRNEIDSSMVVIMDKVRYVDKDLIKHIRHQLISYTSFLKKIDMPDSISVSTTEHRYNGITKLISGGIDLVGNDKRLPNKGLLLELMMQLEGCESRVNFLKNEFNSVCKKINRPDLYFREKLNAESVSF